jgi:aspartyl-tRNA(Asn)/glutamyl-tRNA(Gln) amidotransferase subunit A
MTLHELTAYEAAAAIRRGEISPVELLNALLIRINSLEPQIIAWSLIDRVGALAAARQLETEGLRGEFRGPLHGIPFAAKDIFYTASLPTEAGSKLYRNFIPSYSATTVTRLKEAGAVLLGKTQTTELANLDPAPTRNPWNLGHTPGGSSSGSAAAVAARMVPVALGSQTGGSALRPASYCGAVGLKPTFGRVSLHGVMPLAWTLDHVGLFGRSVRDTALLLAVTAAHDLADPGSALEPVPDYLIAVDERQPPAVGVLRSFFFERADPEVQRITNAAIARLVASGARLEEAELPTSFSAIHSAHTTCEQVEMAAVHSDQYREKPDLYSPGNRETIEIGALITGDLYLRAMRIRRRFRNDVQQLLQRFDVLLTPTTPTPAPRGLSSTGDPIYQSPWSSAGVPTISLPIGLTESGLPLGLQLIASPFTEAVLLRAAAWCESILGPLAAPPLPSPAISASRSHG